MKKLIFVQYTVASKLAVMAGYLVEKVWDAPTDSSLLRPLLVVKEATI